MYTHTCVMSSHKLDRESIDPPPTRLSLEPPHSSFHCFNYYRTIANPYPKGGQEVRGSPPLTLAKTTVDAALVYVRTGAPHPFFKSRKVVTILEAPAVFFRCCSCMVYTSGSRWPFFLVLSRRPVVCAACYRCRDVVDLSSPSCRSSASTYERPKH